MKTLYDGLGELTDQLLGIDDTWDGENQPRFKSVSSRLRLCEESEPVNDSFTKSLYDKLAANWDGVQSRSDQNWRFTKNDALAEHAKSPEVCLNRTFIRLADSNWANEIPVDSGIGEGRKSVDFAQQVGKEFSLIELKWDSNTPLSAAIQVLEYGLGYIFSRVNAEGLGYGQPPSKELLKATYVHLRVLAPQSYYSRFLETDWLQKLEATLDSGISSLAEATVGCNATMSFGFEQFPTEFNWDLTRRNEEDMQKEVLCAMCQRRRVFE